MADLTVFFDGACNLCRGSAERVRRLDKAQRVDFLDLHDAAALRRFPQVQPEIAMLWMQAVNANGKVFSGSDAWAQIGALLPGWKMVAWILRIPGIRWFAGKIYSWIARNRYRWNRTACHDGTCQVHFDKTPSPRV